MVLPTVLNLVTGLISILIVLIMVRVLITWLPGMDRSNPIVRVLAAIVDPVLAPFRRVLPTFSGIDFSPLLAIIVLGALAQIIGGLAYAGSVSILAVIVSVIRQLIVDIAVFFALITAVRIVISLFRASRNHPLTWSLLSISDPLVRPFKGVVPRTTGIESAAVVALVAYIAVIVAANIGLGFLQSMVA
jgi:YggT family protein